MSSVSINGVSYEIEQLPANIQQKLLLVQTGREQVAEIMKEVQQLNNKIALIRAGQAYIEAEILTDIQELSSIEHNDKY